MLEFIKFVQPLTSISLGNIALIGLATFYIASVFQWSYIARPLRRLVGIVDWDEDDMDGWDYPDTLLGRLFSCFFCLTFWSGLFTLIIYLTLPQLLIPFSIAGLAVLFDRIR